MERRKPQAQVGSVMKFSEAQGHRTSPACLPAPACMVFKPVDTVIPLKENAFALALCESERRLCKWVGKRCLCFLNS